MRAWLIGVALLVAAGVTASTRSTDTAEAALQRFLSADETPLTAFTALRRLEARNDHFNANAWMEVRTEGDADGFRYTIVGEGGSGYIRSKVFMPALETEREMWGRPTRGAFTPANYRFEDRGEDPDGLLMIGVTPRRKELVLVNGSILLRPEDSDLVRVEGTLAKTPSFWTRRVEIVRHYERVAGVRVPVRLESIAHILIAGRSTMTMAYQYESVNGVPVTPRPVPASH
jgi:hypothetical protein